MLEYLTPCRTAVAIYYSFIFLLLSHSQGGAIVPQLGLSYETSDSIFNRPKMGQKWQSILYSCLPLLSQSIDTVAHVALVCTLLSALLLRLFNGCTRDTHICATGAAEQRSFFPLRHTVGCAIARAFQNYPGHRDWGRKNVLQILLSFLFAGPREKWCVLSKISASPCPF